MLCSARSRLDANEATVENKTLSNMEILMNELEKAKRATDIDSLLD
jgi:hypothetical protein